ncbi:MAG: alpha/beta fold hydrolase [Sandaracinaceae bacterium]
MERLETLSVGAETFRAITAGPPGGATVLCLHGFPDVPATWRPVMDRLAEHGYRSVAPYLRGYDPSPTEGPFHLEQLTGDLLEMAAALGHPTPLYLLGHDWGAVVTYLALSEAPAAFTAAVTVAVPHPLAFLENLPLMPGQLRRSAYMARFQLPSAEAALAADDFREVDELWRTWSPGWTPPAEHLRRVKDTLFRSLPAPLGYYRAVVWPPQAAVARVTGARARERRIGVPVLYLHGDQDGCIAPDLGRGQEKYFEEGCLSTEVLPGLGHFAQLEDPDRIARRIIDFLARHPGAAASARSTG